MISSNHIPRCPFVTAVGGTKGINPETAVSFSGGGFSRYFAAPSYQTTAVNTFLAGLGTKFSGLFKCVTNTLILLDTPSHGLLARQDVLTQMYLRRVRISKLLLVAPRKTLLERVLALRWDLIYFF